MIKTEHGVIRIADPDDAGSLYKLYDTQAPRAALLDKRREPLMPTKAELQELLGTKEAALQSFFAIEDRRGLINGFCSLRGMTQEAAFGELTLLFLEDSGYESPLAEDALEFLYQRGFEQFRLSKLVAHALESEAAWRAMLQRSGFACAGAMRDAYYGRGEYQNIEIYTRFAPELARANQDN